MAEIETSLAEREVSMMSTDLKDEYERQIENIRSLRALYEQRQAATKAERDLMASQLTDAKNNLENEQKKIGYVLLTRTLTLNGVNYVTLRKSANVVSVK